jgi:pimeloyl-ACP methyl ester carboxylesterase
LRLSTNVTEDFLGGTPRSVPERYAAASPAELLPLGVPQALIHGTEDDSVPYAISEGYHAAAHAAGDDVALVTLPGAGHFELVDPATPEWAAVLAETQRLLGGVRASE